MLSFFQQSLASDKYCAEKGKRFDIHLFGYTFENESQKKLALRGITELRNEFKVGDKVRLFVYSGHDYSIAYEACVPGCPEKSFTEQLLSSECSAMVAKRDSQEFQKVFNSKVLLEFKSSPSQYDIFESMQSLADAYRSTSQKDAVYAVISLIPKGVDPKNAIQLNKLYVVKRETIKFPQSFPPVKLIGNSTDQELILFWTDVFRGKANFEFSKY